MMRARVRIVAGVVACLLSVLTLRAQRPPHSQLLLVVDGLRPDYVTQEVMPRLSALGRRGVVFNAHHSVFPTVTRVNAASISTGAYPESHGILGNTVFAPKVYANRGLNTSQADQLQLMEKAEGKLITAGPTLGEALKRAGMKFAVFSAGSNGSALLLNHPVYDGAVINPDFVDPPSLAPQVLAAVGVGPKETEPNIARNVWAVNAYLSVGLNTLKPEVAAIWFGDPDATAHQTGIGSPLTVVALQSVDEEIGRIEDTLRQRGLLATTNIIVTSDHGFSTHTGTLQLGTAVSRFARPIDGGRDIVVTEGAVNFIGPRDPARVADVVAELQKRPEIGAIFTRPQSQGSMIGIVPGTLSFNVARWNHARASEIMVSGNWTDERNAAGFPGQTTQAGTAGHGTSSPFDVHNTLIAAGPDFRSGATSGVPTSNVDLAPTLLRLLGLPVPPSMTGRIIAEALADGPSINSMTVTHTTERAVNADRSYEVTAHISTVAGQRYLDYTEVVRR